MTLEQFGWLDVDEQLSWLQRHAPIFLSRIKNDLIIFNTASRKFDRYVDENIDYAGGWYNNHEQLSWINAVAESYEYVCIDIEYDAWDGFHELDPEEFVNIVDHYRDLDAYPFEEEDEGESADEELREINCEGLAALI